MWPYQGPPSSAKMIKSTWSLFLFHSGVFSKTLHPLYSSDPVALHFTWRKKTWGGELCPPSKVTKGTTEGQWSEDCIGIHVPIFYKCKSLPFLFLGEYLGLKTWEDSFILLEADSDEQLTSFVVKRGGGIILPLSSQESWNLEMHSPLVHLLVYNFAWGFLYFIIHFLVSWQFLRY